MSPPSLANPRRLPFKSGNFVMIYQQPPSVIHSFFNEQTTYKNYRHQGTCNPIKLLLNDNKHVQQQKARKQHPNSNNKNS